jgi:N-methylhydantoinase A
MSIAIDTGGTFTDVVFYDEHKKLFWSAKVSSNPDNPEIPFIEGLNKVLKRAQRSLAARDDLVHGTTIVTNALLEEKTAKVGLLVTKGFRDLLEIGRQHRPNLYDFTIDRKPPLVSRECIREVKERITSDKKILQSLDIENAEKQIKALKKINIEVLAFALLFSFLNPKHEKKLEKLAQKEFPKKYVFCSSQVSPEFREYERASTTVISAAVAPTVINYIQALENNLKKERSNQGILRIMHSGGGTFNPYEAMRYPHNLIESGPAAGLIGASYLAKRLNRKKVIAFDMGGTTAKAGIILKGTLQFSQEYEVGGEFHHAGRQRGSGYPIRTPMIDVVECGAGAGSIAWIDHGGHLKVGPQSAGADPGPACYGKGGENPTVTDAHVILGRISADSFIGGEMPLYPQYSRETITRNIGKPLNKPLEKAAAGILSVANASMLRILRLVSVARGHDPRGFTLMAYGGAGPLHATELAEKMSIRHVIIPQMAGLFSTLGLLFADTKKDFVKTTMLPLTRRAFLNKTLYRLTTQADAWFEQNDVPLKLRKITFSADLRYFNQNYELNLPLLSQVIMKEDIPTIRDRFHEKHANTYGHSSPQEKIQVVNLRLRATKLNPKPIWPKLFYSNNTSNKRQFKSRPVFLEGKEYECHIYERALLPIGIKIIGPAIIQEKESTILVGHRWSFKVDKMGNIILRDRMQSF